MSGKVFDGDESEPATPSLAAQSQSSAQTALSEPVAPSAHEVQDIFVRLAEVLYSGETEGPLFCFEHMKRYLKDSVPGMPTSVLSNGPTYQTQVVKKPSAEFVSKRTAPGMEGHHARALCWEALVLSVLAVMQPFIIPSLDSVVCPTPVSLQIIMERCECSVQQMQARPGPHLRLAALSKPEPSVHPIPFSHTVSIMFQIALALAAAHSLNGSHKDHPQEVIMAVIHGNVQPGNILLRSSDSLPVICGWSHSMVRWRSRSGSQHVFTAAEVPDDPFHNAPELQAAEDARSALEALSDRTDVWGFALVSLFLLTGAAPGRRARSRTARSRTASAHMSPGVAHAPPLLADGTAMAARSCVDWRATAEALVQGRLHITACGWRVSRRPASTTPRRTTPSRRWPPTLSCGGPPGGTFSPCCCTASRTTPRSGPRCGSVCTPSAPSRRATFSRTPTKCTRRLGAPPPAPGRLPPPAASRRCCTSR